MEVKRKIKITPIRKEHKNEDSYKKRKTLTYAKKKKEERSNRRKKTFKKIFGFLY